MVVLAVIAGVCLVLTLLVWYAMRKIDQGDPSWTSAPGKNQDPESW